EKRRQDRAEQNISGVTHLTDQLLAVGPPREVRKALKQFAKRIDERASQPRELPALLSELGSLQQQTLAALDGEAGQVRPGLLQRLFGSKGGAPSSPVGDDPAPLEMARPVTPALAPAETPSAVADVTASPSSEVPAPTA